MTSSGNETDRLLPSATRDADVTQPETVRPRGRSTCCSARCRSRLFFVEPVLVLYFFSEFPVDIIAQRYVLTWISEELSSNTSSSNSSDQTPCVVNGSSADREFQDRVQSFSSMFNVLESLVWGLPAIVSTLVLGAGSDRLGRRFAILPPLLGVVCSSCVVHTVVRWKLSILWLFVGDLLYGACGSFTAMTMSCYSYVADRTPAESRMLRITVLEMCMLVSGVVSPIALGSVTARIGNAQTLLIILAAAVANFTYVFIFLPSKSERSATDAAGSGKKELEIDVKPAAPAAAAAGVSAAAAASDDDCLGAGNRNEPCQTCSNSLSIQGDPPQTDVISDASLPLVSGYNTTNINCSPNEVLVASNPSQLSPSQNALNHVNYSSILSTSPPSPPSPPPPPPTVCSSIRDGIRELPMLFLLPGPRRWRLLLLLFAFFISSLPTFDFSLATLFEMNRPLCWTLNEIGVFTGAALGVSTVGALIVAPVMKRCLSDVSVAVWAAFCSFATNVYKAFVLNSLMMYLSTSLSMFTILLVPSIRSVMSSLVDDNEQGAVFGAIASVEVVCGIVGTVVFNSVYSSTLYIATSFVFVVMAAFYAVGCLCLIVYAVRDSLQRRQQQQQHMTATVNV